MVKKLFLISLTLTISCSLFNNDEDVIIDSQFAAQKWMFLDTYDNLNLRKYDSNEVKKAAYHIIYDLRKTTTGNCTITHSERDNDYYKRCSWIIQGEAPEIFFTLSYQITSDNNRTNYFKYFYKIEELSQEKFKLTLINESL